MVTRPQRWHDRVAMLVAATFGLLSGCGSTPTDLPTQDLAPVALPGRWSDAPMATEPGQTEARTPDAGTGTDPLVMARWWQAFGDPLLTQLVTQTLQANTRIEAGQAALRQAQALREVAAAALGPTLDATASAQRSQANGLAAANRFQVGLAAAWSPDWAGGGRAALDASEARVGVQAATLGQTQVELAATLALAYLDLRNAQVRLRIAQDNLASQQETLQLTQWREQAGLVTALETAQAEAAAEQTRALLPALRTVARQSAHAIAVLTGQPPAALDAQLDPPQAAPGAAIASAAAPDTPASTPASTSPSSTSTLSAANTAAVLPRPPPDLALSLPADTLRQRADVRASEFALRAAWADLAQADAARAPSLQLSGSIGLSALTLGALGSSGAGIGALLAGVSLPLFDGGARRAQVRAQQAAYDQARAAYRASVLQALLSVEDGLLILRGDRERAQRLQLASDAAGRAALLARLRYGSGLIDFQVVLDTQRSQLASQDSLASALAAISADHVRLYQALGGGWRADQPRPTPAAAPLN